MADDLKQTGTQDDQHINVQQDPELKPKGVDPVKAARFIDAARALGVSESEEAFDKAMRALLKLKPKRGKELEV